MMNKMITNINVGDVVTFDASKLFWRYRDFLEINDRPASEICRFMSDYEPKGKSIAIVTFIGPHPTQSEEFGNLAILKTIYDKIIISRVSRLKHHKLNLHNDLEYDFAVKLIDEMKIPLRIKL